MAARRGCAAAGLDHTSAAVSECPGAGHHSPIGGYLENEDLVFVLDVNRDYRPWLVERTRLFDAMNTWDGDKKRGMLLIE